MRTGTTILAQQTHGPRSHEKTSPASIPFCEGPVGKTHPFSGLCRRVACRGFTAKTLVDQVYLQALSRQCPLHPTCSFGCRRCLMTVVAGALRLLRSPDGYKSRCVVQNMQPSRSSSRSPSPQVRSGCATPPLPPLSSPRFLSSRASALERMDSVTTGSGRLSFLHSNGKQSRTLPTAGCQSPHRSTYSSS